MIVRIYYEDTDSGGVVYYANYLKYMERARTEWLRELGFEQDSMLTEEGVIFAVKTVTIDYRTAAHFNDQLEVKTILHKLGRASITFQQNIYRGEEIVTTATVKIASIKSKSFKPTAIPKQLYMKINSI